MTNCSCRSYESVLKRLAATKQQLEAAQLHIKELREALHAIADPNANHPRFKEPGSFDRMYEDIACEALAKQPDTRALDKVLLEARIDQMEDVLAWHPLEGSHEEYDSGLMRELREKLAELNKE